MSKIKNPTRKIIISIISTLISILWFPLFIIIVLFLLWLFIYVSLTWMFWWWLWKIDEWVSWSVAWFITQSIFKDWYHSDEPLWFPMTWSFPRNTFWKHKWDWQWATVAIDFNWFHRWWWVVDDTKSMLDIEENLWNSKKKLRDYDLEYMKWQIKELHSWPKHCTVWKSVSRIKTAPIYSTITWVIVKLKRNSDCFWNQIVIKWEKYATNYAHLDTMHWEKWNEVKAWELIWTMWNSWNSSWAHLHYDILQNRWLIWTLINTITQYTWSLWIANYFAIKEEEYMRLVTMYWAYEWQWRVWWDHVWKNAQTLIWNFQNSQDSWWDDSMKTWMEKFLDWWVNAVKWHLLNHWSTWVLKDKSDKSVDFYWKLITWTIIWREKSASYNRKSELQNYIIARDWWAWLWQTQEPITELKRQYEQFWWYDWSDWLWKVTKWYWCWWDWRKIIHQETIWKEALERRWCDFSKDTRFDIEKSTWEHYWKEIWDKILSCKSSWFWNKKWADMNDFERWICIVTRYNWWALWRDMQNYQINFLRDVTLWEKNYESCRSLEKVKEAAATRAKWRQVYYDNCSYSYQFALNYAKMIKFWSTQFNWLSRFQKDSKKDVISIWDSNYEVPDSLKSN